MSLITKTGQEAKKSATEKKVDFKKVYIRLKDGESVRVRLLGITDKSVGEYKAHGDFKKGIYTAPCIEPTGEECPYCVASNSGVEGWDNFYARKRYLIVFADIDSQEIRVWDASKQQGESMIKLLEEYAGAIYSMPFTFKRTGAGASDTSYNLIPILSPDEATKQKFEDSKTLEVPDDFFDTVLVPRSRESMIENLKKAGFPVEDFFEVSETGTGDETSNADSSTDDESIDISEDDLPF